MKLPDVSILKTLTQGPEARALERARALAAEGKIDKVLQTLQAALEKQPDSETLLLENARYLLAGARETDAGECLKRILRRNPRRIDVVQEFIEEVKMKQPAVGTFYDAVAEHHIRVEDFPRALETMERIAPEELRVYQGRQLAKWDAVQKNAPLAKLTKNSLHSAYYVALALERVGDYPKAAQAYKSMLDKNPEEGDRICSRLEGILARDYQNLKLRLALVDLLLRVGKIPEALRHLEQSLEVDAAGSGAQVTARVEKIVQKQPGNVEALWLLTRARRAEAKYPEMLAALSSLAAAGGHGSDIINLLEELTPKMDEHPPLRLALADAYLAAKKPILAVEAILLASEKVGDDAVAAGLEKVIRAHPDHARTYLLLGDLDFKAGRTARGVERYEKALALSPEDGPILVPKLLSLLDSGVSVPSLCLALARIYLKEGDRDRAALLLRYRLRKDPEPAADFVELTQQGHAAEPGHFGMRLALAETLVAVKQGEPAIATLAPALEESSPRVVEVLRILSQAARISPEAARAAIPVFRDAAARKIAPAAARFGEGEAALHAGMIGEAVQAFRGLATQSPERMEEIRQVFEKLLEAHPETIEVRYILAGLYLDRKDYRAAAGELKRIRSLNPDLLAPVLARYREAIKTSPGDIEVRLGLSAALLLSGQYEEVQSLAAETLRLRDDETTAPIQLDLGDVALQKGDPVAAVKRFYNVFRKNPRLGAEVATRLEAVLHLQPNLSLASLALGKLLPEIGRVADAVARLLEAFRNDPRISEGVLTELDRIRSAYPVSPEAAAARVEILCSLGKDEAAVEAIEGVLETRPDGARSMIPRLESILTRAPRLAAAHLAMARAQRALKEPALAAEACRSAYRCDRTAAPRIIKICAELIGDDPKVPLPYLAMAEIYFADGETQAAAEKLAQAASRTEGPQDEILALLEQIVAKDGGTARIALFSGEILARAGRNAAAARAYRKALDRDSGMLDAALKGLHVLIDKDGNLAEARLARAHVLSLRQEVDAAVEDLETAARLSPSLAPEIIPEAKHLLERRGGNYRLLVLLADLLLASERGREGCEILDAELKRSWSPTERLALLVRLWRARLDRGEPAEARKALQEAETLASDRNHLLGRVHEYVVAHLRREVNALRERVLQGKPSPSDLNRLASGLLALGETGEALSLTAAGNGVLETSDLLRIHSEAAIQESDYFRAAEILKPMGPNRRLAFTAERGGDFLLACRTLEQLAAAGPDPEVRSALQRAYRRLVLQELEPGRHKLIGETVLRFGN